MTTTEILPFTGDPAADRLLVEDPLALLIGFVLDQQVTLQKAFSGPLELSKRIGGLDAKRIATMDPEKLDRSSASARPFTASRATWRTDPGAVRDLVEHYDGDASRIWREAGDGATFTSGCSPCRLRADEGRHARRDPRQAARRRAGGLGGGRPGPHDARRRRLGGEAPPLPGRKRA